MSMIVSDRPQAPRPESGAPARSTAPPAGVIMVAAVVFPLVLAYCLATMSETRVTAVVAALVCLGVILARPFWGLLVFVGLLYARPEETIPSLQGMHLALAVSCVTAIGMVFQLLLRREPLAKSPVMGMILGFAAVAIATTFNFGNTDQALQDIGKLVLMFVLVVNLVRTPPAYRAFITTLIVLSVYLALYSLYLTYTGKALLHDSVERSQATGIFGDPNDLAATLVAGLALVLMRVTSARGIWRGAYLAGAALLLVAILSTHSRGGMIATLVVIGGFSMLLIRRKPLALLLALVLGAGLLLAGGRQTNFDSSEASANERFWFWYYGTEFLKEHPVMGLGYGQFVENNGGRTAHNTFVLCFSELGLTGYFCFIGALYYCYRRRPRGEGEPEETEEEKQERIGTRLALAGILTASYFLSRTYEPITFLMISLPVAAQMGMRGTPEHMKLKPRERLVDYARIAGISLASVVFIRMMADFYK